jgi:hypothetical protein
MLAFLTRFNKLIASIAAYHYCVNVLDQIRTILFLYSDLHWNKYPTSPSSGNNGFHNLRRSIANLKTQYVT